jgi:hypothetical protein
MSSEWTPLERMLGTELCESFIYMGRDGEIYLYKRIDTRRYLNLDAQGQCFSYTGSGYEPELRARAIAHVFG